MFQDITPHIFDNQYRNVEAEDESYFIYASGGNVLIKENGEFFIPRIGEFDRGLFRAVYLFSMDGQSFFMPHFLDIESEKAIVRCWKEKSGYTMSHMESFKDMIPKWLYFAIMTAVQISNWYRNNHFCGCCGKELAHRPDERALYCPACKNTVYPKISPAVIVGVVHQNSILMTKYADRRDGTRYALIAGFAEVGETIEETVRREVMEEVGLRVKNIQYYKSQPWPFSDSLLLGFFCELDGSGNIILDEKELSEAEWVAREDMEVEDDGISLTYEMMNYFRRQVIYLKSKI